MLQHSPCLLNSHKNISLYYKHTLLFTKMKKSIFLLVLFAVAGIESSAQSIQTFKLPNGLTVYIWEDKTKPDVQGEVVVRTGSKNDPAAYTGLSHYLEHVLFKGNENIGTLDWEKEKPIYEKIIAKYDEKAKETDPVKKLAINKEINQLAIEESKLSLSNEFSHLVAEMGGKGLNASTSYDVTEYHNSFPPSQLGRFLELYAERLVNPVFRSFQSELEAVYEEYNRSQDNSNSQIESLLMKSMFPSHPYGRDIIGLPEHLKNPQLSELITYFKAWYSPDNMALILSGNIDAKTAIPLIKDKFSRLIRTKTPDVQTYPDWDIKGRKEVSSNIGYYPQLYIAFKGIPHGGANEIALDVCMEMLSNRSQTGLLDKLRIDGDVMAVNAEEYFLIDQGRIILFGVPYYDPNQRRWDSFKSMEKLFLKEIDKLKTGNFDVQLLSLVKQNIKRAYLLRLESNEGKTSLLQDAFMTKKELSETLAYTDKVDAITVEDIKRVANQYFGNDYLSLCINEGKPAKGKKIEKPKIDSIQQPKGQKSEYAKWFESAETPAAKPVFADFNEVKTKPVNTYTKLFYTPNTENDIFTLTIKYGVGTQKMPYLEYAVQMLNNAGIMGMYDPQPFKAELARLNASCSYRVDDSYLYVTIEGNDANLKDVLNLVTRQILMPKLDTKQVINLQGSVIQSRLLEQKEDELVADALNKYLLYQNKSDYIDRPKIQSIFYDMGVSKLTGEFQRATDYAAEVHYCGNLSFDSAYAVLSKNLPLKAVEKQSESPVVKETYNYKENTIYFLSNSDVKQAKLFFYVKGNTYDPKDMIYYNAFNHYFGDGTMCDLVFEEIRENNAMAYSSYGILNQPALKEKPVTFIGEVGSQSDKANDAIDLYLSLLTNMPEYPDRMQALKNYLDFVMGSNQPTMRAKSQRYEMWKRLGFTEDPAIVATETLKKMTFGQLVQFYKKELKGKPYAIAIMGDPKHIDVKRLEKYGKVIRINSSKLFSEDEL
jgi:zinc protease